MTPFLLFAKPIVLAVQWGAAWRGGRINEVFFFYKKMYGKAQNKWP